ncbi:MAG: branched-chain amino acid ABC transporter substrate-binding protein [Peptococcaceae bacterium BICA1-7]|nr:MAG: branched-chain amino acid ABC transporter substrate-binding protein [Peptococcaceae bacterium BICA1-7]
MRIKSKWFVVLMVVLLSMALVVSGCGGDKKADDKTIKMGVIAPLTGDVKTFGESTVNAVKLALEQANYKAGDFTIELVQADDRNDATEAMNVATKLISQDRVNVLVGSVTSKTTIPVSKMANESKVVMLTGTATNEKVTVEDGKRKDYVFRACFIDPFQGKVGAKFALDNLKKKTAAVLYDQGNDYTIGLANNFKASFEAGGGQVTDFLAYSKDDVDFSAVLTNIAKKNPDVLYLPDYYQKVSLIGKQAREKGIKAVFIGGDGWDSPELDYKTMEGSYFTNHYSADDPSPQVKKFVDDYKAKYGKVPDALAALAYDATLLELNAIKTANSKDADAIKTAMQNTKDFQTVSGKITFDKDGNPIKAATLLQIKDGKQTFVATVTP